MAEEILVVFTTWPDLETARAAGQKLVEEKFAACANIVPGMESIYRWQGKVETSPEILVLFKTTRSGYPILEKRISELHGYEVPEIIAVRVSDGLPDYLRWVEEGCGRA